MTWRDVGELGQRLEAVRRGRLDAVMPAAKVAEFRRWAGDMGTYTDAEGVSIRVGVQRQDGAAYGWVVLLFARGRAGLIYDRVHIGTANDPDPPRELEDWPTFRVDD